MPLLTKQLVDSKAISREQATAIESELKSNPEKTEEELLVARGLIEEGKLFELKGQILGIPFVSDPPEDISLEILQTVPEETAKFYRMIPLGQKKVGSTDRNGQSRRLEGAGGA
jgi:GSPII_E N-terminal domain.